MFFGSTQPRLVQQHGSRVRVTFAKCTLAIRGERVRQLHLHANKSSNRTIVKRVRLVDLVAYRTRDDERRARLIDEHRVDLVNNRVGVRALHTLIQRDDHVVAQVVEPELVVGSVRDVALVRGATLVTSGLGVVQTADGQTQILVEMAHPLRIATSQVRVHRDEVRALSGKRVEVERQCRNQRLALARRHFGDSTPMKLDSSHELNVVVDHVPDFVAAGDVCRRAKKSARSLAHRGECLGKNLLERTRNRRAKLTLESTAAIRAAQLVVDLLPLRRQRCPSLALPQIRNAPLQIRRRFRDTSPEFRRLTRQLFVRDRLQLRVFRVDRVDQGLNASPLPIVPGAKDVSDQTSYFCNHLYNLSDSIISATASCTKPRTDRLLRARARISVDETSTTRPECSLSVVRANISI